MYAPYGEERLNQHPFSYRERFTFTGKERDTETGYTHYDARYLLPALSFWGSVDPLVDKYIYNSGYVYCEGNPIKFVDPDGRWVHMAVGALIGGVSDYAFQVGMNMLNGDEFSTALTHDISFGSIAFSAAAGAVGVGLAKNVSKAQQAVKLANNAQKVVKQGQKAKSIGAYIKPNGGNAKPHGGPKHNSALDKGISQSKQQGQQNIRKNQCQVDANGRKVGNNRPDLQYDENGQHVCVEYDSHPENGLKHQQTIQANDPNAKVILRTVE